ncbi:hypothetical protein [Mycolicibacterium sp.]|uniref:hypothetical protein n=1 Tax=Mycolicibacterium sp. TaxID=2320850 RepID=UPI0025F297CA|nr:hypothetical protein [Mycolicibacterium sp.]MCB9408092.1 hypothetical protein [Mycolicibacterium sp.]MCB9424192.1 hypothetical protein [Actinomycetota bacterium]
MVHCQRCGAEIPDAQKPSRKWCSDRCRKAASRNGITARPRTAAAPAPARSGLLEAVTAEVAALDRTGTVAGQLALELARRIEAAPPGVNVAALSKELQSALAAVGRSAPAAPSRLDELRRRRDRKRGGQPRPL